MNKKFRIDMDGMKSKQLQTLFANIVGCTLVAILAGGCSLPGVINTGLWTKAQAKGAAARRAGKFEEAEESLSEACERARGDGFMEQAELFQSESELGFLYLQTHRKADAQLYLQKALTCADQLWRKQDNKFPFDEMNGTRFVRVLNALATMEIEDKHWSEAGQLLGRALVLEKRFLPDSSQDSFQTRKSLESILDGKEKEEAER